MQLLKISLCCCLLATASFTMALEDWQTWPLEELERQMSPSRWNPNKTADQVIKEYIDDGLQGTKKARESLLCMVNISYGSDPSEKLDIYGTDLPNNAPIFLWIHGGYWQEGSKDISAGLALNLHSLGIRTAVLGYTLAPNAKIGKMQEELQSALRVILKQYPNCKIILGGHSAGAQLSANVLYGSSAPEIFDKLSGLVLVSGIYDLRLLVPTYVNIPLKMTPQEAESLSPLIKTGINPSLANKNLKVLFMHGTLDSPEFQKQSIAYSQVLKNEPGVGVQSYESNNDDHFTIVQHLANSHSGSGKELNLFLQQFVR